MRKIKVKLTSGNVVEKTLLTAFKGTYGDYVVLDNESVGSMGLPVILIAKALDNKLMTITDANEWNAVKENLRNIIAGNQIIKINVLDEYSGEDVFYKQLTLPVASFEALKKTYADEGGANLNIPAAPEVAPAATPVPPVNEAPAAPVTSAVPLVNETPIAPNIEMSSAPEAPATPQEVAPLNVNPDVVTPEQVQAGPSEAPVPPMAPAAQAVESPVMPEAPVAPAIELNEAPAVEPIPPMAEMANNNIDFAKEKETFLKACENMFDALVSKFNR